jgi:hypothetical protein
MKSSSCNVNSNNLKPTSTKLVNKHKTLNSRHIDMQKINSALNSRSEVEVSNNIYIIIHNCNNLFRTNR